jgi:hypothetical protein
MRVAPSEKQVGQVIEEVRRRLRDIPRFPVWLRDAEVEEIIRRVA